MRIPEEAKKLTNVHAVLGKTVARFAACAAHRIFAAAAAISFAIATSLTVSPNSVGASTTPTAPTSPSTILGIATSFDEIDALELRQAGKDRIAIVDENQNGVADTVDDLYLYDHDSDGSIDCVVDWQDLDADGQTDRQSIFYPTVGLLGPGFNGFIIQSSGDHRGFWATERGQYVQKSCQFRSDFHGPGFFTAIQWEPKKEHWTPFDESPFCFFDPDADGLSEESLRVSGRGTRVHSVRWSFDTDNDSTPPIALSLPSSPQGLFAEDYSRAYDYDISITALTHGFAKSEYVDTLEIRNGAPLRVISPQTVREWAGTHRFKRVCLTFDEADQNIASEDTERRDRWEGVIAKSPGRGFPQVGNPNCGVLNKRYELRDGAPRAIEVYFSPVDQRIHLKGAQMGFMNLDRNEDGTVDGRLEMKDQDEDGYFDSWFWDGDGDGKFEHQYQIESPSFVETRYSFEPLNRIESILLQENGLTQRERFLDQVEVWTSAGRFVPADSLSHFRK